MWTVCVCASAFVATQVAMLGLRPGRQFSVPAAAVAAAASARAVKRNRAKREKCRETERKPAKRPP